MPSPDRVAPAILETTGVSKRFRGIHALQGLSVSIRPNQITALVGPNGAGKSTAVGVICGFIRPDTGTIVFRARRIEGLGPHRIARLGILRSFQRPRIFPGLTVLDSVRLAATAPRAEGLALVLANLWRRTPTYEHQHVPRARECLELCRIAHRAGDYAGNLSYGEQKLLMLAQLLAMDGELLCLDELCAGLSGHLVEEVKTIMRDLVARGKTIVFVEHNLALVREIADRVAFLHQGALVSEGETDAVLRDPRLIHLYLGD
jgi:branched-chain amino acid transport system ATP-binding protein